MGKCHLCLENFYKYRFDLLECLMDENDYDPQAILDIVNIRDTAHLRALYLIRKRSKSIESFENQEQEKYGQEVTHG